MFKDNPEEKQKWLFRFLSLAGLGIILLLFFSLGREMLSRDKISSRIGNLQTQTTDLTLQNEDLKYKIDNWNSTGEMEANARVQLGLKKSGEKAFVVVRAEDGLEATSAEPIMIRSSQDLIDLSETEGRIDESNLIKWWRYFFH